MTEYRLHGPPGTGKTSTLVSTWIPRAIERAGPEQIVFCSLTRAAAKEAASKGVPLPKDNVGTLHAIAWRALGRPGIAEDPKWLKEWAEVRPDLAFGAVSGSSFEDAPGVHMGGEEEGGGTGPMAEAQVLRHRLVPREDWPEGTARFMAAWDAFKLERGLVDFTDILEIFLARVEGRQHHMLHVESVSSGFPWEDEGMPAPRVLIGDEVQDWAPLELALIRKWGERSDFLVLAGDLDQSLYGFRGAVPEAFMAVSVPAENNYALTQSWRLPRSVHARAAAWLSQIQSSYKVEYRPRDADGLVRQSQGSLLRPDVVLDEVEAYLDQHEREKTAMVLAPCSYQLLPLLAEARRRGLPFQNAYRTTQGAWNPMRGVGRLATFVDPLDGSKEALPPALWTWKDMHYAMEPLRAAGTIVRGAKSNMEKRAKLGPTVRVTIRDLMDALEPAAFVELLQATSRGHPEDWYGSRLRNQKDFSFAMEVARRRGKAALKEEPRLTFGTVHSVKGGEASAVFLAPDLSPKFFQSWFFEPAIHQELVRLFYVGMTRAREELHLLEPSNRKRAVTW